MFASMTPFKSLTTRFKISTQSPGESALLTPGIFQLPFKNILPVPEKSQQIGIYTHWDCVLDFGLVEINRKHCYLDRGW